MNYFCRLCRAILPGLALLLFASPALSENALEKHLDVKSRQFSLLSEQYDLFESTLRSDMESLSGFLDDAEKQFMELDFLMRLSISNPYEMRMLFRQMYALSEELAEARAGYSKWMNDVTANIDLLRGAFRELSKIEAVSQTPELLQSLSALRDRLSALDARMTKLDQLLTPYGQRLDALREKADATIALVEDQLQSALQYYLFELTTPLISPATWAKAPLVLKVMSISAGEFLLAKLPDAPREWGMTLLRFLSVLALALVIRRLLLRKLTPVLASWRPLAMAPLAETLLLDAIGAAFFAAAAGLAFPESGVMEVLGGLFLIRGGMVFAWGLRRTSELESKTSPVAPVFWLYFLGEMLQLVNISVLVPSLIWLGAIPLIMYSMRRTARRPWPGLERNLLRATWWGGFIILAMIILGYAALAFFSTMFWFMFMIGLQTGTGLAGIFKERLREHGGSIGSASHILILGLGVPLIWGSVAAIYCWWLMEELGAARIFYNLFETSRPLYLLLTAAGVFLINRFLTTTLAVYNAYAVSKKRPLKGYVQLVKMFVYIIGLIVAACIVFDASPWGFLGGIGAMTAVLLFIFKDTILSLLASIQIGVNDLVRIGDWIEMPKYGANGDVIDVALHTVKVQNFDKTIVTIPTPRLIDESFRNWRGMSESGGRRIKRRLLIDQQDIRFMDQELFDRLSGVNLLADYFKEKRDKVKPAPGKTASIPELLNSRRLTNLGSFRTYIENYLKNNPLIRKDMTFIVRQLEPTPEGLPLEVYVFSKDTAWKNYEAIQADIFDHLLAAAPVFDLHIYQRRGNRAGNEASDANGEAYSSAAAPAAGGL
jgi:miniconductance mechanosensitive channel